MYMLISQIIYSRIGVLLTSNLLLGDWLGFAVHVCTHTHTHPGFHGRKTEKGRHFIAQGIPKQKKEV